MDLDLDKNDAPEVTTSDYLEISEVSPCDERSSTAVVASTSENVPHSSHDAIASSSKDYLEFTQFSPSRETGTTAAVASISKEDPHSSHDAVASTSSDFLPFPEYSPPHEASTSSDFLPFTEYPPTTESGIIEAVASTSGNVPYSSDDAVASTSSSSNMDEDCVCIDYDSNTTLSKSPIRMSPLTFSANISTMFTDLPFMERFQKARECGFRHVAIPNPYEYSIEELNAARGDMKIDLVNTYDDDHVMGCAAIPGCYTDFISSINKAIHYQFWLGFKKLHITSGLKLDQYTIEEQKDAFVYNLKYLVETDCLENRNMVAVIGPSSIHAKYLIKDYETAIEIIDRVGSDQVKLLLDVCHLHEIQGHLFRYLPRYYEKAGHIQVSQSPGQRSPFDEGEINYDAVFKYLQRRGHTGIIGLECLSSGNAEVYKNLVNSHW